MSRLVEVPRSGEPPIEGEPQTLKIPKEFIDEYNHVNHAIYVMLFDGARRSAGMGIDKLVACLSTTYSKELVEGDDAGIRTFEYNHAGGFETIFQTIKKAGETKGVEQATLLIPSPDNLWTPEELPEFSLTGKNLVVDDNATAPVPENVNHSLYAPLFAQERAKALKKKNATVESIRDEHDTLIVTVQLDAIYGEQKKVDGQLNVESKAYFDRAVGGHFMGMAFLQTATTTNGIFAAAQLTRYLFVDPDKSKKVRIKPISKALQEQLSQKPSGIFKKL